MRVASARLLVGRASGELGAAVARLHGRHLDARTDALGAQALRDRLVEELCAAVDGEAGEGLAARVRGDCEDVASAAREHAGQHRPDGVEHALAVDVDRLINN